jgi:hypothetical protein
MPDGFVGEAAGLDKRGWKPPPQFMAFNRVSEVSKLINHEQDDQR